jgi:glycosyltransferase involved in cell wall biosynthesis
MKILVLTFAYPSVERPADGVFVAEQTRAIAEDHEVAVVHLDRSGRRLAIEVVPGGDWTTVRVRYGRSKMSYLSHFLGAYLAVRRLRRQGFEPDVIHAHFFPAALPALLLPRLFRAPVVLTEHWSVFLPESPETLSQPMLRLVRLALPRARAVLPVSEALRTGMAALGIHANYRVVPNTVDETVFHPVPRPADAVRRLLFVGLLYEAKALEDLLRAFALLTATRNDVRLEIVGDGPARPGYERLAAELGLQERVAFTGLKTKAEVAERMGAADLFVLTSRYETNGCALIEAQASGLPAVATDVGGVAETLQPGAGLLARAGSPDDIANRIGQALDGLEQFDRARIAEAAHARFGSRAFRQTMSAVYHEAARGR